VTSTPLTPILDAISILSPAAFLFRGQPVAVPPGPVLPIPGLQSHPLPQFPLTRELQSQLYSHAYSRPFHDSSPLAPFATDPTYLQRLAAANQTPARWESGWSIYAVSTTGQVSLQKGDRQRTAQPGEYLTSGPPGVPPQPGVTVTLSVPRDSAMAQPGFYFLYSGTLTDVWDEHHLLRFYFHATAEGAPALLERLTTQLNRYQIPFRMKALMEPDMYYRTDAVVLYLARRYHQIAIRLMLDIPPAVAAGLRPETPLFTLPLRPGVGLAEEPNTGESFGMHRCRLVAEGVVDAWQRGDQSSAGRIAAIDARFTASGFSLQQPHLSPASVDFEAPLERVEFAHA